MASDVTMPRLSDSMEEGTVLKWLVEEGGEVKRGEPLVEIETDKANMTYESDTDGTLIEVVVRDWGIGIPTRDLDRIFERFYRVDRGRGRDTGGTGLGLSIVRHIASNHGGDVLVTSVEGEGSTFTLRLPARPGPVGVVAQAG